MTTPTALHLEREAIELWLEKRNPRESILIFLVGFSVIYMLWSLIFEWPLHHKTQMLAKQNVAMTKDVASQQQSLLDIERMISSSSFIRQLAQQERLNNQSATVGKQIKNMSVNFVPLEDLSKVTNDVIAQQAEVALVSMKTFAPELWIDAKNKKMDFLYTMQDVYKHTMELEFRGTYFNAIAFLNHLEKLSWRLYWDKLDYQVGAYPEAKVVARFYVLSNQKG